MGDEAGKEHQMGQMGWLTAFISHSANLNKCTNLLKTEGIVCTIYV